jgi:ankyrin repeat protein
MSASPASMPSSEEQIELILSCRYGDLEDVQEFVKKFGPESLTKIRDDNGNTALHMICGNGHSGESLIVQSLDIESHSSKIFGRYPWFPGADRTSNVVGCPK